MLGVGVSVDGAAVPPGETDGTVAGVDMAAVSVGGIGVSVGETGVSVSGTDVSVGIAGVAVGGTGVAVGGTGVAAVSSPWGSAAINISATIACPSGPMAKSRNPWANSDGAPSVTMLSGRKRVYVPFTMLAGVGSTPSIGTGLTLLSTKTRDINPIELRVAATAGLT